MNINILKIEIQEFIDTHLSSEISSLLLKGIPFNFIDSKEIIEQIEAKKRCKNKLQTWFNTKNIYYANKLNIEVHAGHGLDYKTTKILSKIKEIEEFNIGHFIVGESIFFGLSSVIKKFKRIINN